jgi:hypothetical protein
MGAGNTAINTIYTNKDFTDSAALASELQGQIWSYRQGVNPEFRGS